MIALILIILLGIFLIIIGLAINTTKILTESKSYLDEEE